MSRRGFDDLTPMRQAGLGLLGWVERNRVRNVILSTHLVQRLQRMPSWPLAGNLRCKARARCSRVVMRSRPYRSPWPMRAGQVLMFLTSH
jgi:hypothetical protein